MNDTQPGGVLPVSSNPGVARVQATEARLRAELASVGFEGPVYARFENELAGYAVPRMIGLVRSKNVLDLCARRHVRGTRMLAAFAGTSWPDRSEAEDLALETVARALPLFRRKGLVEGRWQPARGAALTTYFLGTCVHVFPDVYRSWHGARERSGVVLVGDPATLERLRPGLGSFGPDGLGLDPLSRMIAREDLRRHLPEDRRLSAILLLVAEGHSHAEIGDIIGIPSRAVEGALYRYRLRHENRRAEGRR